MKDFNQYYRNAETRFKTLKYDYDRLRSKVENVQEQYCHFCFDTVKTTSEDHNYVCSKCIQFLRGLHKIKARQINYFCCICFKDVRENGSLHTWFGAFKSLRGIGPVHQYNHIECVKSKITPSIEITINKNTQLKLL